MTAALTTTAPVLDLNDLPPDLIVRYRRGDKAHVTTVGDLLGLLARPATTAAPTPATKVPGKAAGQHLKYLLVAARRNDTEAMYHQLLKCFTLMGQGWVEGKMLDPSKNDEERKAKDRVRGMVERLDRGEAP